MAMTLRARKMCDVLMCCCLSYANMLLRSYCCYYASLLGNLALFLLLLPFAFQVWLSGVGTRRVTCIRMGTGTGRNPPPCTGMGMMTGELFCYGDGDGKVIPGGESPVAIPNMVGLAQITDVKVHKHS